MGALMPVTSVYSVTPEHHDYTHSMHSASPIVTTMVSAVPIGHETDSTQSVQVHFEEGYSAPAQVIQFSFTSVFSCVHDQLSMRVQIQLDTLSAMHKSLSPNIDSFTKLHNSMPPLTMSDLLRKYVQFLMYQYYQVKVICNPEQQMTHHREPSTTQQQQQQQRDEQHENVHEKNQV